MPAVSIALTWKLCDPSASAGVTYGDVQAAKAAPSSAHWKVAVSFAVKVKLGVDTLLGLVGLLLMVVSGGVVSGTVVFMTHVYDSGVASTFPDPSVALTWKLCDPSGSDGVVNGVIQPAKAAPSSEHWKKAGSEAVKENTPTEFEEGLVGLDPKVVTGTVVSTTKVKPRADADALPAVSTA